MTCTHATIWTIDDTTNRYRCECGDLMNQPVLTEDQICFRCGHLTLAHTTAGCSYEKCHCTATYTHLMTPPPPRRTTEQKIADLVQDHATTPKDLTQALTDLFRDTTDHQPLTPTEHHERCIALGHETLAQENNALHRTLANARKQNDNLRTQLNRANTQARQKRRQLRTLTDIIKNDDMNDPNTIARLTHHANQPSMQATTEPTP